MRLKGDVNSAFTLIELLIVVAIVAIMAAALLPVFGNAREKARQTTCASNLRQIGTALLTYLQDNDEIYPKAAYPNATTTDTTAWYFAVDPYVKAGFAQSTAQEVSAESSGGPGRSVWVCPDFAATNNTAGLPFPQSLSALQASYAAIPSRSYVINAVLTGLSFANLSYASSLTPMSMTKLSYPSQDVLVAEGRGNGAYTDGNDTNIFGAPAYFSASALEAQQPSQAVAIASAFASLPYLDNANYGIARPRHTGGSNYLLADGHVKWFPAPSPNLQTNGQIASRSQIGVVYRRSSSPTAVAFFRED